MRLKTVFKGEGMPPAIMRQQRIAEAKGKHVEKDSPTISRDHAIFIGNDIISQIRVTDSNVRVSFAGSIRREIEQVHDIDILISPFSEKIKNLISSWQGTELLWAGNDKVSIVMPVGDLLGTKVQVDVRFISPESWGAALQYFTGSREHNISIRRIAKNRNLLLNEHGLFDALGKRIDDGTESSVYKSLGLRWLPPKYRNGFIQRTPKPTWCIDHQVKDFCKRSRHLLKKDASKENSNLLARKSNDRTDAGDSGAPALAAQEVARKGGASLKNPDVITDIEPKKQQHAFGCPWYFGAGCSCLVDTK